MPKSKVIAVPSVCPALQATIRLDVVRRWMT